MAAHPKSYLPLDQAEKKTVAKTLRAVTRKVDAKRVAQREPIAAAKAKAHFLQLLDEVERNRQPITITKRGRVVAQLMPASEPQAISNFDQVYGSMKGRGKITGDIISPDWESWGPQWR